MIESIRNILGSRGREGGREGGWVGRTYLLSIEQTHVVGDAGLGHHLGREGGREDKREGWSDRLDWRKGGNEEKEEGREGRREGEREGIPGWRGW
jgi:hypothetical protein